MRMDQIDEPVVLARVAFAEIIAILTRAMGCCGCGCCCIGGAVADAPHKTQNDFHRAAANLVAKLKDR